MIAHSQNWHHQNTLVGQIQGDTVIGSYGVYGCTVDWNLIPWGYIGSSTGQILVGPKCENLDLSTLVDEYYSPKIYQVNYKPTCDDFVTSVIGTEHFSWAKWMTSQTKRSAHAGYGLAKGGVFPNMLETTHLYYNRGRLKVESGYRCPHVNAIVSDAQDSRHQYGDAVDLTPIDQPWCYEEWFLLVYAAIEDAWFSWYEPWGDQHGETTSHVHVDNR